VPVTYCDSASVHSTCGCLRPATLCAAAAVPSCVNQPCSSRSSQVCSYCSMCLTSRECRWSVVTAACACVVGVQAPTTLPQCLCLIGIMPRCPQVTHVQVGAPAKLMSHYVHCTCGVTVCCEAVLKTLHAARWQQHRWHTKIN
jgi:hypothetical protein